MAQITKIDPASLPGMNDVQFDGCCLYVLEECRGNYFKIGIAGHPVRRLSSLQCGNPRRLEIVAAYRGSRAHCKEIEAIALRFFRAAAGSEWFRSETLTEIKEFLGAFEVPE